LAEITYRLNGGAERTSGPLLSGMNSYTIPDIIPAYAGTVSSRRIYEIKIRPAIFDNWGTADPIIIGNFQDMSISSARQPVHINSAADIMNIGVLGNMPLNGVFMLAKDIEISSNWTPKGTSSAPFTGTFYGMGRNIDAKFSAFTAAVNVGIFGVVNDARIQDLHVTYHVNNTVIPQQPEVTTLNAGGIIGSAQGSSILRNLYVKGISNTVELHNTGSLSGVLNIGGVVGLVGNQVVFHSNSAEINVRVTKNNDGQISVGGLAGNTSGTINRSRAGGNVYVTRTGDMGNTYMGGLIGMSAQGIISNCYALGNIDASLTVIGHNHFGGGLVGYGLNMNVETCFAKGDVKLRSNNLNPSYRIYAGGIIGFHEISGYRSHVLTRLVALGMEVSATNANTSAPRSANRVLGAISPGTGVLSRSLLYARANMQTGTSAVGVDATPPMSIPTTNLGHTENNGESVSAEPPHGIYQAAFWQSTANFNAAGANIWDYTGIGTRGYPLLVGIGGQR
jgi:hypothetical protein